MFNSKLKTQNSKRLMADGWRLTAGFSLVELMIVIAKKLGIGIGNGNVTVQTLPIPKPSSTPPYRYQNRKPAFSLVELMIVVAILGILAAIVLPQYTSQSQKAKEAAAKENLRILRDAIEHYAIKHNDVAPGYPQNNKSSTPYTTMLYRQIIQQTRYLFKFPPNPFNSNSYVTTLQNTQPVPNQATGDSGWIYKPATKTIKLNWPGTDSSGTRYYDY